MWQKMQFVFVALGENKASSYGFIPVSLQLGSHEEEGKVRRVIYYYYLPSYY